MKIRYLLIVVLVVVILVTFVVLYNKNNSETHPVATTPITEEIKEKTVLALTKNIETLTEKELLELYHNSNPLPWSSDSDFSNFYILGSMSATDDIDTNVRLVLKKDYTLNENNVAHYYYQMVTKDNDVILIPKSEDCSYNEKNDSFIFNTTTSECVEAMLQLRMYAKAKNKDFKILDYSIIESSVSIDVIYYEGVIEDKDLVISKIIESISKGNGNVSISKENIATIKN